MNNHMTRRTLLFGMAAAAAVSEADAAKNTPIPSQVLVLIVKKDAIDTYRIMTDTIVSPKNFRADDKKVKSIAYTTARGDVKIIEAGQGETMKAFDVLKDGKDAQHLGTHDQVNKWATEQGYPAPMREN